MKITDVCDFTNTTESITENNIDEIKPALSLSIPSGMLFICLLSLMISMMIKSL